MPRGIRDLIKDLWRRGGFDTERAKTYDFTSVHSPESARASPLTPRLEHVTDGDLLQRVVEQLDLEAWRHNLHTTNVAAVPPRGSWLARYFADKSYHCEERIPIVIEADGTLRVDDPLENFGEHAWQGGGVLLLDNAILTGASAIRTAKALREAGYSLEGLLTVMTWRIGGEEAFLTALHGHVPRSLFTVEQAAEVGCDLGYLNGTQMRDILQTIPRRGCIPCVSV